MVTTLCHRRNRAFTLIELLVVIAIITILAALLLPSLQLGKARAMRAQCEGNLRQTAIAFRLFAHDHDGKYPMRVSTNQEGSLEYVAAVYRESRATLSKSCFQMFRPLASEIVTPAPFACPADAERLVATNFDHFDNRNLGYCVGLKADPGTPECILAADRNFPACGETPYTLSIGYIPYNGGMAWRAANHGSTGNILFSDGRVEMCASSLLPSKSLVANDLLYPSVFADQPEPGRVFSTASAPSAGSGMKPTPSAGGSGPAGPSIPSATGLASAPTTGPSQAAPASPRNMTKTLLSGAGIISTPVPASELAVEEHQTTSNRTIAAAAPKQEAPPVPETAGSKPELAELFVTAGRESWEATRWLWWLLLLLLVVILFARWLDRRLRERRRRIAARRNYVR